MMTLIKATMMVMTMMMMMTVTMINIIILLTSLRLMVTWEGFRDEGRSDSGIRTV
jgi:hypothetical protein